VLDDVKVSAIDDRVTERLKALDSVHPVVISIRLAPEIYVAYNCPDPVYVKLVPTILKQYGVGLVTLVAVMLPVPN
jgi:hypothetical protein